MDEQQFWDPLKLPLHERDFTVIKRAFLRGDPVLYEGIIYKCISAIINRRIGQKTIVQLELQDDRANSVTIARTYWSDDDGAASPTETIVND